MDKKEINRKIAEIMGWELRPFPGGSGRVAWCQYFADIDRWIWHCDENDLPDYATNIAQAFGVVEELKKGGLCLFLYQDENDDWNASFSDDHSDRISPKWSVSYSPEMAICLAALAAKEGEK